MSATEILAFDRDSIREFDKFGRMHVKLTPISKATVNEYFGREIPNSEALGLSPDQKYSLLRDPKELAKAVPTANNLPVMGVHIAQTPDEPHQDKIVGSTGTDAVFDAPYLKNSMVIWVSDAIDGVESNKKRQLSCSYSYDADMTSGVYEGMHYSGVMRNIKFNHVAIIPEGRAGPDVLVEDSLPAELRDFSTGQGNKMTISHKATLARGVLASFVRPRLASDQAMPDLKAVLLGTTAANWPTAKAVVAKRLVAATKGRLAKDASVEEVQALLNCLDGEADNEPDSMDDEPDGMDEEAETEEEKAERMKRRTEAKDKAARDAEGETEEEMRKRHAEELKSAKDKSAKDKSAKDAEGETEEEKKAKDKAARDRAAKDKARDSEPKPITKEAMDSALAANADQIRREMRAEAQHYQEALEIVKPVLGSVLAQDSADGVFRVLFKHAGVDVIGVPPAAFKALAIQTVKASGTRTEAPRLAADAATVTAFAKKFPSAAAVRRIG